MEPGLERRVPYFVAKERPSAPPWKRVIRIAAIVVGSFLVLVVAAVAAIVIYVGTAGFRGEVEQRAGVALGREIKIGDLWIDWSWSPVVRLQDVVLGAAAKESPPLLEAKSIQFELRLVPLLWGDVILPDLRLDQPKLALARDEKGIPNWSFSENPATAAAAEVVAPEERTEAPVIGQIDIKDGHFTYEDKSRDLTLEGDITTATGEAEKVRGVRFEAKGKLQGKPLLVKFAGGSIMALRDDDNPYPLDLFAAYGDTEVSVKGTAGDPFTLEAADLDLSLKGPDLSEIFPLLSVPAPPTPPYNLKGHLVRGDEKWQFTNMQGRIGDSDMAGAITIDYGRKKPLLTADLKSRSLDFDDLAPLVGAPPDSDETASPEQKKTAAELKQKDELFPDVPLKVDLLGVMDMEVKLDAKKVTAENYLPIETLAGTVAIRGGKAVVKPLHMRVAGGGVDGALSLDSGPKPAVAAADLKMRGVDVKQFFRGTDFIDTTGGKLSGDVDIKGQGKSLADVMGTANGKTFIAMSGGSMSGLLIEGAGLDIAEALLLYVTDDARVPIRCAAGHIDLSNGDAHFDRLIMDTTDSVLYFRGQTNLRKQTMKMDIFADAKDFSILDIDAPVHLQGKIRDPEISIGKGVPIPLIEPGDAEDINCNLLLSGKL
ncbi:MAG TPA: AsmA family protein [Dongiaceae bacterium]|nr:AsmA family protein [Dongiaceae bacterium]